MKAKMSGPTRRELLSHTRKRYINASWREKGKILDDLIAENAGQFSSNQLRRCSGIYQT